MSVILSESGNTLGGEAAQTGNLVHTGVHAFHVATESRADAAEEALRSARANFPGGDEATALGILRSYTADPENINATVRWVEQPVRLVLDPTLDDPTGEPIVIKGTLDQVRQDADGRLTVWDVKTGSRLTADETVLHYTVQQAVYVMAARASLDASIEPGGIIYTPGYVKVRGRVRLPSPFTAADCPDLVSILPLYVSRIRAGIPIVRPGKDACAYCPSKPFPRCTALYRGFYA